MGEQRGPANRLAIRGPDAVRTWRCQNVKGRGLYSGLHPTQRGPASHVWPVPLGISRVICGNACFDSHEAAAPGGDDEQAAMVTVPSSPIRSQCTYTVPPQPSDSRQGSMRNLGDMGRIDVSPFLWPPRPGSVCTSARSRLGTGATGGRMHSRGHPQSHGPSFPCSLGYTGQRGALPTLDRNTHGMAQRMRRPEKPASARNQTGTPMGAVIHGWTVARRWGALGCFFFWPCSLSFLLDFSGPLPLVPLARDATSPPDYGLCALGRSRPLVRRCRCTCRMH